MVKILIEEYILNNVNPGLNFNVNYRVNLPNTHHYEMNLTKLAQQRYKDIFEVVLKTSCPVVELTKKDGTPFSVNNAMENNVCMVERKIPEVYIYEDIETKTYINYHILSFRLYR